jgi:acetylornithine/succinyldiaminopimelate/putrescine aminotransferase
MALKVLEIIERDRLAGHVRQAGAELRQGLVALAAEFPQILREIRGMGLILGLELAADYPGLTANKRTAALEMVHRLHRNGLLAVPSGNQVIRLLPPLNMSAAEMEEALRILRGTLLELAS